MELDPVLQEHERVLQHLKAVRRSNKGDLASREAVRQVLKALQLGWLSPGPYILARIEAAELSARNILNQPAALQRKWFQELDLPQRDRWVKNFQFERKSDRLEISKAKP